MDTQKEEIEHEFDKCNGFQDNTNYVIKKLNMGSTNIMGFKITQIVTNLAWGSRLRQGLTKVQAESETWESHFMLT